MGVNTGFLQKKIWKISKILADFSPYISFPLQFVFMGGGNGPLPLNTPKPSISVQLKVYMLNTVLKKAFISINSKIKIEKELL